MARKKPVRQRTICHVLRASILEVFLRKKSPGNSPGHAPNTCDNQGFELTGEFPVSWFLRVLDIHWKGSSRKPPKTWPLPGRGDSAPSRMGWCPQTRGTEPQEKKQLTEPSLQAAAARTFCRVRHMSLSDYVVYLREYAAHFGLTEMIRFNLKAHVRVRKIPHVAVVVI